MQPFHIYALIETKIKLIEMKRYLVFVLIFFLVFLINLNLVNALDYMDKYSSRGYYFDSGEYAEEAGIPGTEGLPAEVPTKVPFQETQVASQQTMSQFYTLVFQFFGMVILLILLIILIQTLISSQ